MVLILNGVVEECPMDSKSLFIAHPIFRESASKFAREPSKVLGPAGILYVHQREFAATAPSDENVDILGSDDATTCIIVIIRHSGSGAVALTHLDTFVNTEKIICSMIQRLQELSLSSPEGCFELQLLGGYSDGYNDKDELFYKIMLSCHKHVLEINLTLACIGEENTTIRRGINYPKTYGVAINIKTGQIFPATFSDKGPDTPMRQAWCFSGSEDFFKIYDSKAGLLKIGPYYYEEFPDLDIDDLLLQSDDYILNACSSSPEVEPPNFIKDTKAALKFLQNLKLRTAPEFKQNCSRLYGRDKHTGTWELLLK